MDFNLATKKAATKRIKQAVAEPIMARLNRQGHEDEERRSLPARLRRRSSLKSRRSQRGSLESMVRKESPERAQIAKDDVFHEVAGRAWTHCTRSCRSTRPFTTIKSNEMKPMNLQEQVKKLEEQESAINVAYPMTRRVGSSRAKVATRRKSHSSMVGL